MNIEEAERRRIEEIKEEEKRRAEVSLLGYLTGEDMYRSGITGRQIDWKSPIVS